MSTNLNSGPWLTLQEERRRKRKIKQELRHRFGRYYDGWKAYRQGEPIFAPHWWPDEDRADYHEGWEDAQKLAWDFRQRKEKA